MSKKQETKQKKMDKLIAALTLYGYKLYLTSFYTNTKFYIGTKKGIDSIYISRTKKRIAIYTAGSLTKKTTLPLSIPHAMEIVQIYENNFKV